MFHNRFTLYLFVVFVLACVLVIPVRAQDATPEPAPVVIVNPPGDVSLTGAELLTYIVLAALGGGGVIAIVFRALERREVQDLTEKLYLSTPPETQEHIRELNRSAQEIVNKLFDFFDRVTDGSPNDSSSTFSQN